MDFHRYFLFLFDFAPILDRRLLGFVGSRMVIGCAEKVIGEILLGNVVVFVIVGVFVSLEERALQV